MVKRFKQFNESLLDKIEGPSKKDVWKSLGYKRIFNTPEDFFKYMFNGVEAELIENNNFVNWVKNDKIVFVQDLDSKELMINYERIWKIFRKIFFMSYSETEIFIHDMITKYLDLGDYTPVCYSDFD